MSEPANEARKLFVAIMDQPELIDDLISGFLDLGIPGATIIESRGMGQIIRQEMPVFAGLASLFPENTGSRMVFSVMTEEQVGNTYKLIEEILAQNDDTKSAICFTLPVDEFQVIRK